MEPPDGPTLKHPNEDKLLKSQSYIVGKISKPAKDQPSQKKTGQQNRPRCKTGQKPARAQKTGQSGNTVIN
uniref:Uncharacterized protein n=1 Tax=Romanomermis culicivorax TaxID=13658 RepID=A0A915K2E9_ROMCU